VVADPQANKNFQMPISEKTGVNPVFSFVASYEKFF
jgi:hypothetical protein